MNLLGSNIGVLGIALLREVRAKRFSIHEEPVFIAAVGRLRFMHRRAVTAAQIPKTSVRGDTTECAKVTFRARVVVNRFGQKISEAVASGAFPSVGLPPGGVYMTTAKGRA